MQSVILEVAIGLALVYYVSATLVSGVAEGLTRLMNTRSKMLWAALARLLKDDDESARTLGAPRIFQSLVPGAQFDPRPEALNAPAPGVTAAGYSSGQRLADFAGAPSVKGLDYVTGGRTKVTNVPGAVFASAILELATIKGTGGTVQARLVSLAAAYGDSPIGQFLATRAAQVGDDVDKITDELSKWFDAQMVRLTETYRKNIKYVLAVIGLIVAVLCNLDTLRIADGLRTDAAVRQVVTATVGDLTSADITAGCQTTVTDPVEKTLNCGLQKLDKMATLGVVIPFSEGWSDRWSSSWTGGANPVSHVLGLAVTVGAMALGGPMWFDFLMFLSGRKKGG